MRISKLVIATMALAFLIVVAGTTAYFNNILSQKDAKIASLESQIPHLNQQLLGIENQINNLTAPNLVATLATQEIWKFSQEYLGGPNYTVPFDFVQISGTVTNTGGGTAYDTGLRVIGYDMNGVLVTNVTVPLGSGFFGSDNSTNQYADISSLANTLSSGQIATIKENVMHEGIAYNWTVTPVWTNSPSTG